jgi:hypothetical protein
MGKKLTGSSPAGGSRDQALTRRQQKRSQRAGQQRSPSISSVQPAAQPSGSSAAPRKPRTRASRPAGRVELAASGIQPSGDQRYPTLARMAAISQHTGSSSQAPSPFPPVETEEASDIDLTSAATSAPPTPAVLEIEENSARLLSETMPVADQDVSGTTSAMSADEAIEEILAKARPARRTPVRTRQLSDPGDRTSARQIASSLSGAAPGDTDPLLREYSPARPQPLPAADLVMPVAVVEAGIAAVSALTTAAQLLLGSAGAFWTLTLTIIAGLGSWLAYTLAYGSASDRRAAGTVLLGSQVGMLVWSLALIGPRASLLLVAPALLLLSLRMTGRMVAAAGLVTMVAVYMLCEILSLNQVLGPAMLLPSGWLAFLDSLLAVLGLGLFLVLALDLHAKRARADHLARVRLHELHQVRARAAQVRQWTEDQAVRLQELLIAALYGRGEVPSLLEGPLSPLNATIELFNERLTILQRDREERLRLEAALLSLTRSMERAWLGLPWTWPALSGTSLDQLVALLRTPTPRDLQSEEGVSQETSPLVPIPSLDPSVTPPPWEAPRVHPRVREHLSDLTWSFAQSATGEGLHNHQHDASSDGPSRVSSPLPWVEWDEWRNWDDRL